MFKCNVCTAQFKTQKGLDNHKCRWVHVRYEEKRKYSYSRFSKYKWENENYLSYRRREKRINKNYKRNNEI